MNDYRELDEYVFRNIGEFLPWAWGDPIRTQGEAVRKVRERRHLDGREAKSKGDIYITESLNLHEWNGAKVWIYDYLAQLWGLSQKEAIKRCADMAGGISPRPTSAPQNHPTPLPAPPPVQPRYIDEIFPRWRAQASEANRHAPNIFTRWLISTFGERVTWEVLNLYDVGTTRRGGALFWYVNGAGRAVDAKEMIYKTDGHRDKTAPPRYFHATFRQTEDHPERPFAQGSRDDMPLFGAHLLPDNPLDPCIIVESEKSAIIGAIWGKTQGGKQFVWLASGGKQAITDKALQALRGRAVYLIPDADGVTDWARLAGRLRQNGLNVYCKDLAKLCAVAGVDVESKPKGYDVGDLFADIANAPKPIPEKLAQALAVNPILQALIERFDLTLDN